MTVHETLAVMILKHGHLTGDCIRTLLKVYEEPDHITYNLKSMAEELRAERRSVRRWVNQLSEIGLVQYHSGKIKPVNVFNMLQNR